MRFNLQVALWLKEHRYKKLSKIFYKRLEKYGVYISYGAKINKSIRFPHPVGIVIGDGVVTGDGLIVYQNVTIGGDKVGAQSHKDYPRIGNDVVIYSGATVVGGISVGSGSIIGANSVVIKDVAPNTLNVGVPSKSLSKKSN